MRVTKAMLARYLGIHRSNVSKYYQTYIDSLELNRDYLTVWDIATIDDVLPKNVATLMGITDKSVLRTL